MSKYLPTVLMVITALGSLLAAPIQHVVAGHPAVAGFLASLTGILLHWLPSPVKS